MLACYDKTKVEVLINQEIKLVSMYNWKDVYKTFSCKLFSTVPAVPGLAGSLGTVKKLCSFTQEW